MAMKTKSLPEKAMSWCGLLPFTLFWVGYSLILVIGAQIEKTSSFKKNNVVGFKVLKSL